MRDFVVLALVFGIIVGYAIGVLKNHDLKGSSWNQHFNLLCIIIAGCIVLALAWTLIKIFVFPILISLMSN